MSIEWPTSMLCYCAAPDIILCLPPHCNPVCSVALRRHWRGKDLQSILAHTLFSQPVFRNIHACLHPLTSHPRASPPARMMSPTRLAAQSVRT
jgi:hypothetical protein